MAVFTFLGKLFESVKSFFVPVEKSPEDQIEDIGENPETLYIIKRVTDDYALKPTDRHIDSEILEALLSFEKENRKQNNNYSLPIDFSKKVIHKLDLNKYSEHFFHFKKYDESVFIKLNLANNFLRSSFLNCKFSYSVLNGNFSKTDFSGSAFEKTNLNGNFSFSKITDVFAENMFIEGVNFTQAFPHTKIFENCNGMTFSGCNLMNCDLPPDAIVKDCLVFHREISAEELN